MAEAKREERRRSSRRRTSRPSRTRQAIARFCAEWHVEIIIVVLVILAIFLLVERVPIRQTLLQWLRQGLQGLETLASKLLQGLFTFVGNTTLSDLTAYGLLIVAVAFVVWRTRWRLMTMPRFTTKECPRCGKELHRIHRHRLDRLLNLLVPVRRYRCKDRECGWQGLRVGRSKHE